MNDEQLKFKKNPPMCYSKNNPMWFSFSAYIATPELQKDNLCVVSSFDTNISTNSGVSSLKKQFLQEIPSHLFPKRLRKAKEDQQFNHLWNFEAIHINIPLIEVIQQMLNY